MRMTTAAMCLLLLLSITGCRRESVSGFHVQDFQLAKYPLVLAFDLRDDDRPVAGLSINQSIHPRGGSNLLALPFPVSIVELDARIAATAGQYRDFTLVSYAVREGEGGYVGLGFLPILGPEPEGLATIETLADAVSLRRSGLEREFLYRYGALEEATSRALAGLSGISIRVPDALAVALPVGSRGREIRDGRTELPTHLDQTTVARYYPGVSTDPAVKALQIRYELPASVPQRKLADAAVKLAGALVAPLLAVGFLPRKDTTHPRVRKAGIAILLVLQSMVLLGLIVLWFRSASEVRTQLTLEVPIVLIGAAAAAVVLWAKK